MSPQSDDRSPNAPIAAPRRRLFATIVGALALVFVGAAIGFVGFLSQLHGAEIKPAQNADGIVVLTGGSSRVSDAMELLAAGYGKRLLISGVHPTNAAIRSPQALARPLPAGGMFWLRRKRFVGSYVALMAASRSHVALG